MSGCRVFAGCLLLISGLLHQTLPALAQQTTPAASSDDNPGLLASKIITAAGGREKLLTTFRLAERFNAGAEKAAPEKSQSRTSILQPPKVWTVGGKERGEEPAKFVVWAWTLGILSDPQTKLESKPGLAEDGKTTLALRASGSVNPAMDLHFDPQSLRLIRVDWRDDIYRFSEWREHDGTAFHAQTTIWKKTAGKPWFFHEVVSVERLAALP
jgi:hypothetical protein